MPSPADNPPPAPAINEAGVFKVNTTSATEAPFPGANTAVFANQDQAKVGEQKNAVLGLFSLVGKTAIVTGAGAGIGLEVAKALAAAGANVIIWYNSNKKAEIRAEEISKEYGVTCQAFPVDVTNYDAVEKAIHSQIKVEGFNNRLDVLIANSGIPWIMGGMIGYGDEADSAKEEQLKHYHKVVATDLDSVFFCARVAGQIWKKQKDSGLSNFQAGSLVATASMSGHIANIPQLQAAYNAAKAGVIHLCRSLAVEWIGFARANTVSPGYMATEISDFIPQTTKDIWKSKIPMGREGSVRELVGAYLYFASNASTYTTGSDLIVDGGYCVP